MCLVKLTGDLPLTISVHAFAVSIPLLAVLIFMRTLVIESSYTYDVEPWWKTGMILGGVFTNLIGVVAIFWHFSWLAAILVTICGILAWLLGLESIFVLERVGSKDQGEDQDENEA